MARIVALFAVFALATAAASAPTATGMMPTAATGCVKPSGWVRPYGNVAISAAGAESCKAQCKAGGYMYYGLECPMGSDVHCQCHDDSSLGVTYGDEYCEGTGNPLVHAHNDCIGPYIAEGYRFGDYTVGSVYLTEPVMMPTAAPTFSVATLTDNSASSPPPFTNKYDNYRKEANVGTHGGVCTCPNGQTYEVGDNNNNCGSIACEGGSAGPCYGIGPNGISASSYGMKVTCGVDCPAFSPTAATGVTATLISGGDTQPASNSLDSDLQTFCHTNDEQNAWIQLDLKSSKTITKVQIWNRPTNQYNAQSRLGHHQIWVSDSSVPSGGAGATGTKCFDGTANISVGPFNEACSATGRYVRIVQLTRNVMNLAMVTAYIVPSDVPAQCYLTQCAAGKYVTSSNTCVDCEQGKYSAAGATACTSAFKLAHDQYVINTKASLTAAEPLYKKAVSLFGSTTGTDSFLTRGAKRRYNNLLAHDSRKNASEQAFACEDSCSPGGNYTGAGTTWNGEAPSQGTSLFGLRQEDASDQFTHQGGTLAWEGKYYKNLPAEIAAQMPLLGSRDMNTGQQNELVLGQGATVYMWRSREWREVSMVGWKFLSNGAYINGYTNVNLYKKEFVAGTYTLDNDAAMYLLAPLPTATPTHDVAGCTANYCDAYKVGASFRNRCAPGAVGHNFALLECQKTCGICVAKTPFANHQLSFNKTLTHDLCSDGKRNGDETGVDCGGSCACCGVDCVYSETTCTCTPACGNTCKCTDTITITTPAAGCGKACPGGTNRNFTGAACATCSDNVQNQAETGVDCGGTCAACPTCSDSVQNGAETGVDCGGTCASCRLAYVFQDSAALKTAAALWTSDRAAALTTYGHISTNWDTSKVTSMGYPFHLFADSTFNDPIGAWNTSQVTNFEAMFHGATAFNQPIGAWHTSKATSMHAMFYNAAAFNQPIGSWDTSKVTNMDYMFQRAAAFNQPIGAWDTSKETNIISMFDQATAMTYPMP